MLNFEPKSNLDRSLLLGVIERDKPYNKSKKSRKAAKFENLVIEMPNDTISNITNVSNSRDLAILSQTSFHSASNSKMTSNRESEFQDQNLDRYTIVQNKR